MTPAVIIHGPQCTPSETLPRNVGLCLPTTTPPGRPFVGFMLQMFQAGLSMNWMLNINNGSEIVPCHPTHIPELLRMPPCSQAMRGLNCLT